MYHLSQSFYDEDMYNDKFPKVFGRTLYYFYCLSKCMKNNSKTDERDNNNLKSKNKEKNSKEKSLFVCNNNNEDSDDVLFSKWISEWKMLQVFKILLSKTFSLQVQA